MSLVQHIEDLPGLLGEYHGDLDLFERLQTPGPVFVTWGRDVKHLTAGKRHEALTHVERACRLHLQPQIA